MDNNLTPDDKNKVGVYFIRKKVTNEFYIGSGKIRDRLKRHERDLTNKRHGNYKLQKSFNNNPDMEFIGKAMDTTAVKNAVNARKEKGSYKSNENQILACSHPVIVDGEVFTSITVCARAKNISRPTVSARVGNSNFPGWAKAPDLLFNA